MKEGKLPPKQRKVLEATFAVQSIPPRPSGSRCAPDPAFHDSIRKEAGQGRRKAPTCFGHEAPAAIGARPSRPSCGAAQRRGSAWRSDGRLGGDTHRVSWTHFTFTSPARPHLTTRPPSLFAEVRFNLRRVALARRRRHLPAAATALPPLRACARGDGGGRSWGGDGGRPGRGSAVAIAVPVG